MKTIVLASIILFLLAGCRSEPWDPVSGDFSIGAPFPADVQLEREPIQVNLDSPPGPFTFRGYSIYPVARYDMAVRVLSRHRYARDGSSEISPVDLAVAWGVKGDPDVVDSLKVRQWSRFYRWEMDRSDLDSLGMSARELGDLSANVHMIPANDDIRRQLMRLRRGDAVKLGGYLVNVDFRDGWWRTSLTRTDRGPGACEILLVTRIKEIPDNL
jgi:hypothetical protein